LFQVRAVALRDISAHEILYTSYLPSQSMSFDDRNKFLRNRFTPYALTFAREDNECIMSYCQCAVCSYDILENRMKSRKRSRNILTSINMPVRDLKLVIDNLMTNEDYPSAIDIIEPMINLDNSEISLILGDLYYTLGVAYLNMKDWLKCHDIWLEGVVRCSGHKLLMDWTNKLKAFPHVTCCWTKHIM